MKDDNINKENEILVHLKDSFMRIFNANGYKSSDKFNKDVWFLKDKLNPEVFHPEGPTPSGFQKNQMLEILEKKSINGTNFNQLEIRVDDFVNEISEVIFEYNNHKIKIEENLAHIGIREKIEKIKLNNTKNKEASSSKSEKYKYLYMEENELFRKSKVEFVFNSISGLSEGEYKITLNYKLNSNDDYFTNKKATIFFINKSTKNIEKQFKLEVLVDNFNEEIRERRIFPIKEYFFEIEKNLKIVFNTEFVSFDPFVLQCIDTIYEKSHLKIQDKVDFQDQEDRGATKYSVKYDLNVSMENQLKDEVIKKTITYYDTLIKGIENLDANTNTLKSYFDEKFVSEIEEILKGNITYSSDACACSNCIVF